MKSEVYFEIRTPLHVNIRTTKEYWNYITGIKHKVLDEKEEIVKAVLSRPDEIRRSRIDSAVFLYYKRVNDKLYCAVARHEYRHGFLITAYPVDKVKEGEVIWIK